MPFGVSPYSYQEEPPLNNKKETVTHIETKETEVMPTYIEPTKPAETAKPEQTASPMGFVGLAVLRRK